MSRGDCQLQIYQTTNIRPSLTKAANFNRRRKPILCFALSAALAISGHALALDLHVSAAGKDANPGTEGAPLATLAAARDAARKVAGKEAVTIHVGDGVYHLPETLVFTPLDSGSAKFPVVYRAVIKTPAAKLAELHRRLGAEITR